MILYVIILLLSIHHFALSDFANVSMSYIISLYCNTQLEYFKLPILFAYTLLSYIAHKYHGFLQNFIIWSTKYCTNIPNEI